MFAVNIIHKSLKKSMKNRRFSYTIRFKITILFMFLTCYANVSFGQPTAGDNQTMPSFKFGGFLQQQFVADQTEGVPEQFLIKRARVGATGTLTEHISVNLIGGFVEPPDRTPALVNAFIDFNIHPLFQVRTGQFLLPFGIESPEVIIFNPAIERTMAIRRLNPFRMFRDVGVQVGGSGSVINYKIAVVNGKGANQAEEFNPKDVLGRIGITPFEHFEIGGSLHFGKYQPVATSEDHEDRFRAGVDASYHGDPVFFRGEYIIREDKLGNGNSLKTNGWYLLGSYKFSDQFQGIARYESFNPNTDLDDNQLTAFTLGANYYFIGNTRVSVNYEIRDDKLNPDLGNLLTVQMQVAL